MIERLPAWSRSCLTMQGYGALSDSERRSLWLGLRFSPLLCFAGIALGTALASPALLLVMALTALLGGFVTPKHPFDYLYAQSTAAPLRLPARNAVGCGDCPCLRNGLDSARLGPRHPPAGDGGDGHGHELVPPLADLRSPARRPRWRAEAPLTTSEHREEM
jgi:hypothetical protein